MRKLIYEIYVNGVFGEAWETHEDARRRIIVLSSQGMVARYSLGTVNKADV